MIYEDVDPSGLVTTEIVRPLAMRVLAVAVVKHAPGDRSGWFGDWSAYIDAVPGMDHRAEWPDVRDLGRKLPEGVAAILFPEVGRMNAERADAGWPAIPWRD
jgi:hypothetical protein